MNGASFAVAREETVASLASVLRAISIRGTTASLKTEVGPILKVAKSSSPDFSRLIVGALV